jgi:K+/H+ antiporter YhaU regulatory subunit KhtT
VIEPGDVLIAVGTASELQALEDMFDPRQTVAG